MSLQTVEVNSVKTTFEKEKTKEHRTAISFLQKIKKLSIVKAMKSIFKKK